MYRPSADLQLSRFRIVQEFLIVSHMLASQVKSSNSGSSKTMPFLNSQVDYLYPEFTTQEAIKALDKILFPFKSSTRLPEYPTIPKLNTMASTEPWPTVLTAD